MLLDMGERPAILSRGYARRTAIRRCGRRQRRQAHSERCRALGRRAADARSNGSAGLCAGVVEPVRRGQSAESRLGCTVHILDDGFQHFDLMRDIDLLVAPETLDDVRTLPAGRFREPLDAASSADALLVVEAKVAQDSVLRSSRRTAALKPAPAHGGVGCRAPQGSGCLRVQPTAGGPCRRQAGVCVCRHCEA